MKYIAKMMLALLASVTLAIPAYAWDFSASGSMSTTFNQTTKKLNESVDALSSTGVGSDAGEIALSSSHSEGDSTVSIKYGLDWDGNLDEVWTASGSTKVGKWTASSSIDYNNDDGAQTAADAPALTLTDGTLTITMGKAGHLASASKGAGDSVADGEVQWMALDDYDIGAATDSFQGVSVGYKLDDTSSVTFVVQAGSTGVLGVGEGEAASSLIGGAGSSSVTTEAIIDDYNAHAQGASSQANCDAITYTGTTAGKDLKITTTDLTSLACYATWKTTDAGKMAVDNATTPGSAAVTGHSVGSEGFGLSYSGAFGAASVDFSYMSATAKSNSSAVTDKAYGNTMSLAVGMDLGTLSPYLTYATYEMGTDGDDGKSGLGETGMRIGTTMAMGEDTVGVEMTTTTAKGTGTNTAEAVSETGIEVGYATSVGPATLSIGYGTYSISTGDASGPYRNFYAAAPSTDYGKGGTKTDMEVKLAYSF